MVGMSKKLEKAMKFVKADDLVGHRLIWSFSVENMDAKGIPPISALVYGANRILLPEMHWDSTPELLDTFALAERIRQQTVNDARKALTWDQFYRKGGDAEADGEPLSDQERKTLKSIAKNTSDENMRETYRTVVMQVCWAHVHCLRRSNETYRIPHFFQRYFPAIFELKHSKRRDGFPLWLRGLSEDEFMVYDATREKLMEFLEEAERWEQDYFKGVPAYEGPPRVIRIEPEYQARFCDKFQLIVQWETLTGIMVRHLAKVQNMFSNLHSIFPERDSTSDSGLETEDDMSPIFRREGHEHAAENSSFLSSRQDQQQDVEMAEGHDQDKKESQESNASSRLSYVDAPKDVACAPPISLLRRIVERG